MRTGVLRKKAMEIRTLKELYNTIQGVELFLDDICPDRTSKINLEQLAVDWGVK